MPFWVSTSAWAFLLILLTVPSKGAYKTPSVGSMAKPLPSMCSLNTGSGTCSNGLKNPCAGDIKSKTDGIKTPYCLFSLL